MLPQAVTVFHGLLNVMCKIGKLAYVAGAEISKKYLK